jgi:hypothetical protein
MQASRPSCGRSVLVGVVPGWGYLVVQGGCGPGEVDVSKPAYTSSEEAQGQRAEINDAIKWGADGKAGKAPAGQPIGIPK